MGTTMIRRLIPLLFVSLWIGCPTGQPDDDDVVDDDSADDDSAADDDDVVDDDDDDVSDDDDSGDDDSDPLDLPPGVTAIAAIFEGEVAGQPYDTEVLWQGDDVTLCSPAGTEGVVRFELVTDPALHPDRGGVEFRAEGFDTDIVSYPEQTLEPSVEGGQYSVIVPEAPDDPALWVAGSCYLFVRTYNCPGSHCGLFICGTLLDPMTNAAGDTVAVQGRYQCLP
jgi:hypothetical protein